MKNKNKKNEIKRCEIKKDVCYRNFERKICLWKEKQVNEVKWMKDKMIKFIKTKKSKTEGMTKQLCLSVSV